MKNKECYLYLAIVIILAFATAFFAIKSSKVEVKFNYTETSKAEYTICLKENDLFKQTCLGEEKQYLSSLTDEVRVTFNYERINNIKNVSNFKYYISSDVVINNAENDKEIFKEEKVLTDEKNYKDKKDVDVIQDKVTIKFDEYDQMINEQLKKYSLNAKAFLHLNLVLVEDGNDKIVSSITIPLAEQTYSISKNVLNNNLDVDNTERNNYIFVTVLFGVLDLAAVALFVFKFLKSRHTESFDEKVKSILIEYDKIIVEVSGPHAIDYTNKQITTVNSFGELVDVRDNIEKPILYVRRADNIRDFVVQDKDIVYIYTMCDTENKGQVINNNEK